MQIDEKIILRALLNDDLFEYLSNRARTNFRPLVGELNVIVQDAAKNDSVRTKSGYVGVYKYGSSGRKWEARIKGNRIGVYDSPEEANEAREDAQKIDKEKENLLPDQLFNQLIQGPLPMTMQDGTMSIELEGED